MPDLRLVEHSTAVVDDTDAWRAVASRLRRDGLTHVVAPEPRWDGQMALRAGGWIGMIPNGDGTALRLAPKVPLAHVWRMLHVAYGLGGKDPLALPAGDTDADPLDALASHLARALADGVRARLRRGLHRAYVARADTLPYLRPRLDAAAFVRQPAPTALPCRYHGLTADSDDNRLLAWTLHRLRRAPLLPAAAHAVRDADRALAPVATLHPFQPADALGRAYTRLTADYAPLHRLCHVLLAALAPGLDAGEARALPFLLNTPELFEMYVHRWMQRHLPPGLAVHAQESHGVGLVTFAPDLVVRDAATGAPLAVLDTKHKASAPSASDVQQVVAYATRLHCTEAWLVYPQVPPPLDAWAGPVRVRSVGFDLSATDLDAAGHRFLDALTLPTAA